jgi:phosphoadenosine phosphosulfate reductase
MASSRNTFLLAGGVGGKTSNNCNPRRMYWQIAGQPALTLVCVRSFRGQIVIRIAVHARICGVRPMNTDAADGPREPTSVRDLIDDRRQDEVFVASADRAIAETFALSVNNAFGQLGPADRLTFLFRNIFGPVVFTTSFGLEDQALTHLIVEAGLDCRFVTLDTGRLFPETHAVWAATEQRYHIRVEALYPCTTALETLVHENGINGFYNSVAARHACCAVRKVEPLRRALRGAAAWLTGLRADQSRSRHALDFATIDAEHRLLKVNPLLDRSRDQVAELVREADIPHNALHAKGFPSIGCAPCTRAVAPGESERAGRWWWEQDQTRECGLHLTSDGRLVRSETAL